MANGTKIRRIKAATEAEIITDPVLDEVKKPKTSAKNSQKNRSAKGGRATRPQGKRRPSAPSRLKAIGQPFLPLGNYIQGSWQELRQTRWPNRRATWSLTLAVIIFCIFFAALILLFDLLFEWLVQNLNGWFHEFYNFISSNNG